MLLYLLAAVIDEPAANVPPPALQSAAPPHNYLKPLSTCDRGDANEVVVCAERDADRRYRLKPMDERQYADAPIRAQTNLGVDTLGVGTKQADVGGFPSNRLMITFTIPF